MADIDLGPEPGRFPGAPHPREQAELFGHEEAERAFLDTFKAGQLHHAWLIGGPEGIGKATFAFRAARFLLAHGTPGALDLSGPASLAVPPGHRAARQVAALSHTDLALVRRGLRGDGKGYSNVILVSDARRAIELFASTAGEGGYRVCIIDAADDLNASSANALLKMLEEPPPRSMFLIVAHAPARTLATLRSRCRRLMLRPLGAGDVRRAIKTLGAPWSEAPGAALDEAAALSQGSVRRALTLLDDNALALVQRARAVLDRLPEIDYPALHALAETCGGRGAEERFDRAFETIADWIAALVRSRAGEGARRLAPLVEAWEKGAREAREAGAFNLDRRPLIIAMVTDLAHALRRSRDAA